MKKNKKLLVFIVSILIVLTSAVGITLASYLDITGKISNLFNPSYVSCEINETFDGVKKSNVVIKNTSDVPVYVRAFIVVTWKDDDGNIYPETPIDGVDYYLRLGAKFYYDETDSKTKNYWDFNVDENGRWDHESYLYYVNPVAPGSSTSGSNLIRECYPYEGQTPVGYHLDVEVIAEVIQSRPLTVVRDTWGVHFDDRVDINDPEAFEKKYGNIKMFKYYTGPNVTGGAS